MTEEIITRCGDGQRIKMSPAQVKEDLLAGTKDAADKGVIAELTASELEQLYEIIADQNRAVSVKRGDEIVFTDDASIIRISEDEGAGGGMGLPLGRVPAVLVHERGFAQDSAIVQSAAVVNVMEIKAELAGEMQTYETASLLATVPLIYMVAPALLWYYRPNGPYDNPAELMPQGKIAEARESQEQAADQLMEDLVHIGKRMHSVGCDCLNLDTTAAMGDSEFYGTLRAVEKLKEVAPEMAIEMGMAGEFILGMHGQVSFKGQRLAGMFPHQQVKVAEEAGVDIFGPVVNTNSSRSFPWNLARAVTFVKETSRVSTIPIHVNGGMGVAAVPMHPTPPIDCVSRVTKAMVQIGKIDGL
jgi:dimethylamine--corrinoid protein Co-methyltransferase